MIGQRITPPKIHLQEGLPEVTRYRCEARRFPLGEQLHDVEGQSDTNFINRILDWLNVEGSPRYRPTDKDTFCNVYACDFAYLYGGYLPRVWWTGSMLCDRNFVHRDARSLGASLREMTANDLFVWLNEFGREFGWSPLSSLRDAQENANSGKAVVISAKAADMSDHGHISIVVPESGHMRASQGIDHFFPAQSQAGRANYRYFLANWWNSAHYSDWMIWAYEK